MRLASQRFFIHNCIYLRILIISYLATFLGSNSLSVLMCRKTVNQSILQTCSCKRAVTQTKLTLRQSRNRGTNSSQWRYYTVLTAAAVFNNTSDLVIVLHESISVCIRVRQFPDKLTSFRKRSGHSITSKAVGINTASAAETKIPLLA